MIVMRKCRKGRATSSSFCLRERQRSRKDGAVERTVHEARRKCMETIKPLT